MGWSWNLGPSVSILLRVDEPRHPRVINCAKGPPPWSKEKEEKEMRDVVHENANLAGKSLLLCLVVLRTRASSFDNTKPGVGFCWKLDDSFRRFAALTIHPSFPPGWSHCDGLAC